MSYAAEPYTQFVDDLLTALTGGVIREPFVFLPEAAPFRLTPPGAIVKSTLAVFGQAAATYQRFQLDRDYTLTADNAIQWKVKADGTPAADAVWPDLGTPFFANYDHRGPSGAAPLLSDRNVGSVTRLLAESFAREYAVVSRQLEAVYRAGFLDTASGRDLEQVVALLGLTRRSRTFAVGTVVFSRSTPAGADVFVPEGTRLSTADAPPVTFETAADCTLHRGDLSVEVAVRATVSGAAGVVSARAVTVIHRPILGIEAAENPQATALGGDDETDVALRTRARRAFESAGKGTVGALVGALTTLPSVREKDLRVDEDHLARPGVVTVNVATTLDTNDAMSAVQLIEQTRAAGIRVMHNLDAPLPLASLAPPSNVVDDASATDAGAKGPSGLYLPIVVHAVLLPASPSLGAADRNALAKKGADAVRAAIADVGLGETVVYNRLVAQLMAINGVLDVAVELFPRPPEGTPATGPRHQNLFPGGTLRARLDDADLTVEVAGEILAFDVTVEVTLTELALATGDPAASLEDARLQIAAELQDKINAIAAPITRDKLLAAIDATDDYTASDLSYTVRYLEAGMVINETNPQITPLELERAWISRVKMDAASG
jgi:hypothetical protein